MGVFGSGVLALLLYNFCKQWAACMFRRSQHNVNVVADCRAQVSSFRNASYLLKIRDAQYTYKRAREPGRENGKSASVTRFFFLLFWHLYYIYYISVCRFVFRNCWLVITFRALAPPPPTFDSPSLSPVEGS